MVYKPFRLNLSNNQLLNAVKGKSIRVKHNQLNTGDKVILLHPMTYKAMMSAYQKKKGITFILAPGEIKATRMSELEGTGIFDFLKKGYNWVKAHWGDIKKVLTPVLDISATALSSAYPQASPGIASGRKLIKDISGASVKPRRCKKTFVADVSDGEGLYLGARGNGLYL